MRKVPVSYLVLMRDWLLDNVSIHTFLRMIGMGVANFDQETQLLHPCAN